jgi:hypothetical protein
VIAYRATLDVPRELAKFTARLLLAERRRRGTPRGSRALTCFWQAVLGLRWFRDRVTPDALARDHGISRRWIHKLVKRFKEGGYAALAPRSRRAHSFPHQTSSEGQAKVLQLRQELVAGGHDAGPKPLPITSWARSNGCPRSPPCGGS